MKLTPDQLRSIDPRPWVLRRRPRAKNHRRPEGGWEVRDGKQVLGTSDHLNDVAWVAAAAFISAHP